MKIIIVSDNHGDYQILDKIIHDNFDADMFLHCGDSQMYSQQLSPYIAVRGNTDFDYSLPDDRLLYTPYGKIYLEHGTNFYFSEEKILKKDVVLYLYGHSHMVNVKMINKRCYLLNPGSTSRPRDDSNGTYLKVILDENDIKVEIVYL